MTNNNLIVPMTFDNDYIIPMSFDEAPPANRENGLIIPMTFGKLPDNTSKKPENAQTSVSRNKSQVMPSTNSTPQPITTNPTLAPMPKLKTKLPTPHKNNNNEKKTSFVLSEERLKDMVLECERLLIYKAIPYRYNGKTYQALDKSELKQLIISTCHDVMHQLDKFEKVNGAYNFLMNEPTIQYNDSIRNQRIITFQNCNLDIETKQAMPHSPNYFTTYALNCNYDAALVNKATPHFDHLLHKISGGNLGIVQRIYEIFGYCLSPDTSAKKCFVFQGRKHSGKSLLAEFLKSFFPEYAVSALSAHDFAVKFSLSELQNRALCISADMSAEPLNDRTVGNIKQISGNDLISAPKKYASNQQFYFDAKLILVSNHMVLSKSADDAFMDRLLAIPFPYSIPKEQQDWHLQSKLASERDAVAAKALAAYWHLKNNSYNFSGDYEVNSGSFLGDTISRKQQNPQQIIKNFLQDNFVSTSTGQGLFIADIHKFFTDEIGEMPLNEFSKIFVNYAEQIFNTEKTRKRKPGEPNPYSYLKGIAYKESISDT